MDRGFSLLEVLAVLVLMALAAAAVSVSLAGPGRKATADDVVGELAQWDLMTRQYARRQGRPVRMLFDLDNGQVVRLEDDGTGAKASGGYGLPEEYRMAQLRLATGRLTGGRTALACSADGCGPTYALLLAGGGQQRWLLVAGLTGQATVLKDEGQIDTLLEPLRADGRDGR